MVSLVNSHTNATRIGWHLREIDLRFATGLPPGWLSYRREYPDTCGWQVGVGYKKNRSILARVAVIGEDGRLILDKHVAPTERVTDYRSHSETRVLYKLSSRKFTTQNDLY